jgi:hypothetical protein
VKPGADPPRLWCSFCTEWLRLTPTIAVGWWAALHQARWSRAVALRSTILGQAVLTQDWRTIQRLYEGGMAPQALVAVLEELLAEGVMTAKVARQLEELVLQQTGPTGQWRQPSDHAARRASA